VHGKNGASARNLADWRAPRGAAAEPLSPERRGQ